MGLFKKKCKALYAMANGTSVAMKDVPDEVFSQNMMGEGIAIQPNEGLIYAPCDGEISMVMERTLHAVGIVNEDGMELLIHIGLDTVELSGEGFESFVKAGDKVYKGDLLIRYDKAMIMEKGLNDITMLVICDANGHVPTQFYPNEQVSVATSKILEYK